MTLMDTTRSLVFSLLAAHAAAAQACYSAPAGQLIGIDEQLGQATNVAVAQVIAATPLDSRAVEYRFLVLEQLTGPPQKVFTVMGYAPGPSDKDTSFHDHRDFAFWARGGGRTMNDSDCHIHPGFVVGNSYLVFLDMPPTWRSFEKLDMFDSIVSHDDKWLAYVRAWLGRDTAKAQDGVPAYERVGRFLYGYQRIVAGAGIDRKTLVAEHAPAKLLLRAGLLLDEFDRIADRLAINHSAVPDAQLDATLREAGEVAAATAAWRNSAGH
jgi:hypothetical protein